MLVLWRGSDLFNKGCCTKAQGNGFESKVKQRASVQHLCTYVKGKGIVSGTHLLFCSQRDNEMLSHPDPFQVEETVSPSESQGILRSHHQLLGYLPSFSTGVL